MGMGDVNHAGNDQVGSGEKEKRLPMTVGSFKLFRIRQCDIGTKVPAHVETQERPLDISDSPSGIPPQVSIGGDIPRPK